MDLNDPISMSFGEQFAMAGRSPSCGFSIGYYVTPVLSRASSLVSPALGASVAVALPAVPALVAAMADANNDDGESEHHSQVAAPPTAARISNAIVLLELGAPVKPALVLQRLRGMATSNTKSHAGKDKSVYLTLGDAPLVSRIQLWGTGKLLVYAKCVEAAKAAAGRVLALLRDVGFALPKPSAVTVRNVVGEAAAGFAVNLPALAEEYAEQSTFDTAKRTQEVNFRLKSGVKCRIFGSGKVSIQGAKSVEAVHTAWGVVYPILCRVRE